ncbi:FtsX-like permease family protein [Bifidobacterium breve]|uniref:FtsX-like permease family protein n=1 Tax=Bifidobacterium breve TaxID=1685 RepID=UPI0030F37306
MKRRNLDDSGGRGAGVSAVFAKDTLRCWLRSWKRFVSIAVITLLGVAVLTGIYAGCRDAFLAAGRFYDQQGLHDLQVLSTYGLTDDDATALRRIDGVQTVQPERSQTVTTLVDGTKKTVTMQEIGTEGLDQPYIRQGKLPNKAGEVAVTQQFLNDSGLKIGGTITVTPQDTSSSVISVAATETDDSNNADTVGVAANASASDAKSDANTDADAEQSPQFPTKLTITGVVLDPRDLNNPDGYSGMTSFRSTSSEDYTFFAPSDGVTGNIYTAISVAITGASDFDTFSDAYDEAIKTVADRIEHQIQATRQKARRQQIVSSAQRKLDDAKDEANEQLDEAQKQIDDNWAELEANKTTLQDSRTELENNRTTITDGERQLADGRAQIASARQQIAQGRQQIAEARTQLESGKAQLTSARKQLDAAQTELTANRTKIEQGITQIDQGVAQIDQMLSMIQQADNLLAQLDPNIDFNSPTWQAIKQLLARLGITLPEVPSISELRQQLAAKQTELQTQRDSLTQQKADLQRTLNETIAPAQSTLDQQNAQLTAKEQEAAAGEAQLNTKSAELEANAATLETQSAQLEAQAAQLASGKQQLEEGEQQLADGKAKLDDAQSELDAKRSEAESEFAKQQRRIDDVANARWYVQTRASIDGFNSLKSDVSSIESIGRAFPIVFLLVAVLMSLTTMTRMVEEDRGLIGTYLGLGYGGLAVSSRYLLFALLACLVGGGIGLLVGFLGIPAFLLVVIEGLYILPGVRLEYDWLYGSAGIVLFVVGVGVATALACREEIRHTPAALMRPKAPKAGARILLERIRPVWSRLNFLGKVTARNIFRFKSRLIMTVGGVAGCTALIICGFAINDTVDTIGVKQYEQIYQYDLMVVANDDDATAMRKQVAQDGQTTETLNLRVDSGEMSNAAQESETVQLMTVPNDSLNILNDMVTLEQAGDDGWFGLPNIFGKAGGGTVALDDSGVIVSQSAANSLNIHAGDTVTLGNGGSSRAKVQVTAVTRNLIGSDVYISERLYDQKFAAGGVTSSASGDGTASTLTWNAMLAKLKGSETEQAEYADRLGEESSVLKAVSCAHLAATFKFDLMGAVVALIVGLAGGLALVVLFTLANTNVSERIREMATLKVLGFYDREVHNYVNREMMILTGMGVVVGLPLGRWIGGLLTAALNMPSLYFEVEVHWYSYAIAVVATLAFALLVQLFTNPVLDRVDPVSSLKSVE